MQIRERIEKTKETLKKANPFKSEQSNEVDVTTEQQRRAHEQTGTHQDEEEIEPAQSEEHTDDELEIGEKKRRQGGTDETLEFYDDE